MTQAPPPATADQTFIRRTLIVFSLAALAVLIWQLRSVLLLVFGSVLVSVIFRAIADPIHRLTRVPDWLAVAIAVLLVVGLIGGAGWMFGAEVSAQFRTLVDSLPEAWATLERRIGDSGFGERLRDMIDDAAPSGSGVLSGISRFAMSFAGGVADTLIVIVGGIYLAAQPRLYRHGALKLVPPHRRALAEKTMQASGNALRLWLRGQLVSMVVVGVLVGTGLWLIGVPSALALGLLAGLLEFIPLIGPIVAALPAILIALVAGPDMALWTLGLYFAIQQIEGNVLQPVVQQYAVDLPAVIMLFSLLGFGILFGALGVILAAPLTVVVYVIVKRLYVKEALDTPTPIPGED